MPLYAIEKVIDLMRSRGVRRLRMSDLELELSDEPRATLEDETRMPSDGDLVAKERIGLEHGRPTDDELMMWSAPLSDFDVATKSPGEP